MKRAAVIVALAMALAACGSSSKPSALESAMAKRYRLEQLTPLLPHATSISAQRAEALATVGRTNGRITNAGLWRVKDPGLYIPEHGIHRLLVNNQVDWIILIHRAKITPGPSGIGPTGASAPTAHEKPEFRTVAVAINAESGKQIESWLLPRHIG